MTKRWHDLRDQTIVGEDAKRDVAHQKRLLTLAGELRGLRERRGLSQSAVAAELDTSQPNISQIEGKDDIHLSTLDRYVQALGGRLEIHAIFDDEDIKVT